MVKPLKKPTIYSSDSSSSSQSESQEEDLFEDSDADDEVVEVSIVKPTQPGKQPVQPEKQLSLLQPPKSKKPVNMHLRSFFRIEKLPDGRTHITCKHPGCAFKKKVNGFNATICCAHLVNSCGGIDISTRFKLLESECANQ